MPIGNVPMRSSFVVRPDSRSVAERYAPTNPADPKVTYRTVLPSASRCGQASTRSPRAASGLATTRADPPASDIATMLLVELPTITPDGPQLMPLGAAKSPRTTTPPPSAGPFFRCLAGTNAIHLPSGEKQGLVAPSVPTSGRASS